MSKNADSNAPVHPDLKEMPWTLTPLAMMQLTLAFSRVAEERFETHGIVPLQCVILHMCAGGYASTLTELGRVIPTDSASLSRHVNILVKKHLLRRRRLRSDRRVVRLELTEDSQNLMSGLNECLNEVDDLLLVGVSQDERRTLVRVIEKIYANYRGAQQERMDEAVDEPR